MKQSNLRDVDKAFIYYVMFEKGIVPMENPSMDMTRALKDISPEEARTFKRKFRKVWRKAWKKVIEQGNKHAVKYQTAALGVGKKSPTRAEKLARKSMVFNLVWQDQIKPMLAEFEKVKRERDVSGLVK